MEKTISECPVCKSKDLLQTTMTPGWNQPFICGGETTTIIPIPNGCVCRNCGTRNEFNIAGDCPICEGKGKYTMTRGTMAYTAAEWDEVCPTCKGEGTI